MAVCVCGSRGAFPHGGTARSLLPTPILCPNPAGGATGTWLVVQAGQPGCGCTLMFCADSLLPPSSRAGRVAAFRRRFWSSLQRIIPWGVYLLTPLHISFVEWVLLRSRLTRRQEDGGACRVLASNGFICRKACEACEARAVEALHAPALNRAGTAVRLFLRRVVANTSSRQARTVTRSSCL